MYVVNIVEYKPDSYKIIFDDNSTYRIEQLYEEMEKVVEYVYNRYKDRVKTRNDMKIINVVQNWWSIYMESAVSNGYTGEDHSKMLCELLGLPWTC